MSNQIFQTKEIETVLIVDDSVENLKLLSGLLKDKYTIKVAKDGKKAVEIVSADPDVDLVLMDVMMPVMDGFEASRSIKNNPSTQHIPIIFLTGLNEVKDETKAFEAGAADFITKPFNVEVVKARIRTHLDLQKERHRANELLKVLLPENVIYQLINKGKYEPEVHKETSVLFCDFVGFTKISSVLPAKVLVDELSDIFTEFDDIIARNNGIRIKTIGDGYMAATGIGNNDKGHADNLVKAGLQIIDYLNLRNSASNLIWECRIGIHSGEIISGIIGKTRFQFDIMGDNVNIASRVESSGKLMKVTITNTTRNLLSENFNAISIGEVNLKGKGEMLLFVVS
ncbi:MAG: response regulator [Flavobacteriales bacterium]|nr:response regulator [Flavobacteriales bacterium]